MNCYFSVLVLTLNEQENILNCLQSLSGCEDIHLLDSYSIDKTVEIAKGLGASVVQRKFDNYASQRNYGLNSISFKHQWILMVDADETVPPQLIKEINQVLENDDDSVTLYRMRRKDFFMGKWIKRSSGYPTYFGRLLKAGCVQVTRSINEEYHTAGEVGLLNGHLHHYPFNKGFHEWFEKHNRYSSMEAELKHAGLEKIKILDFFSKDPVVRRKVVKAFVYRLPFTPVLMFLALYIFRLGFLDGRPGLVFCLLRSFYEFMINCKVLELKLKEKTMSL